MGGKALNKKPEKRKYKMGTIQLDWRIQNVRKEAQQNKHEYMNKRSPKGQEE